MPASIEKFGAHRAPASWRLARNTLYDLIVSILGQSHVHMVVHQSGCSGDPQNGANAYDANFCSSGESDDLLIGGSVQSIWLKVAPGSSGG